MAKTFNELLGDKLIQNNESDEILTDQINGKTVALYFSAHWCPPCRNFTPKLTKVFSELTKEMKDKFDIVFISWDEDEESFKEYFSEMPWKALPFADRQRSEKLGEQFHIDGIPALVVLSSSLETITLEGVDEVRTAPEAALQKYSEGKHLFWSREAQEGEYTWENIKCNECFMSPLIGSRYGCTNEDCRINLCQLCLTKNQHEHPLVEYFIPKQHYSLEKLFSSIPYLLAPKKEENIPIKDILQNDLKSIGLYFSAHWCPPCKHFTPKLAEIYQQAQIDSKSFEIIFISCDRDEQSFDDYRSEMPWPSAPLNSTTLLKAYFQLSGIPSLIILSSDGKILSRKGRDEVGRRGVEALNTWAKGEKLDRPSPDQYQWEYVSCDGCSMSPIIGLRYICSTCGNYDLCEECQKKGHQHELTLQNPPNDDDDD